MAAKKCGRVTKKAGRMERYQVLVSGGRAPEGHKLPSKVVGYTFGRSPEDAIFLALAAAGLADVPASECSAFLCPFGGEREWAAEARVA